MNASLDPERREWLVPPLCTPPSELEPRVHCLSSLIGGPLLDLFHQRDAYRRSWIGKNVFRISGGTSGFGSRVVQLFTDIWPSPGRPTGCFDVLGYNNGDFLRLERAFRFLVRTKAFVELSNLEIAEATALAVAALPSDGNEPDGDAAREQHAFPLRVGDDRGWIPVLKNWNHTKDHFYRRIMRALETADEPNSGQVALRHADGAAEQRLRETPLSGHGGPADRLGETPSRPVYTDRGFGSVVRQRSAEIFADWFWSRGWKIALAVVGLLVLLLVSIVVYFAYFR